MRRLITKRAGILVCFCLLSCLAACVPKPRPPVTVEQALVRIDPSEFPDFSDDLSPGSLFEAIDRSLCYLEKLNPSSPFRLGPDTFTASHMAKSLRTFRYLLENGTATAKAIEDRFWVYKSVGRDEEGSVLFTGYYEPILLGSLDPSPLFPQPLYRWPEDLVTVNPRLFDPKWAGERLVGRVENQTLVPYYSRKDIESGRKPVNNADVLAWVADPVDVFFLQIQGSGRIALDSGALMHVNYNCTNGHPYRSIGKLLIEEGAIPREEMSMQRIRAYLTDHPEDVERVLNYNPSYVFFRVLADGPVGAIEAKLVAGRSIATDLRLFPRAALAFIRSEKPRITYDGDIESWESFGRFVLNHDTGGAIRGPGRVDLFWGNGLYAETAAGHMKHEGELYFLVLKND